MNTKTSGASSKTFETQPEATSPSCQASEDPQNNQSPQDRQDSRSSQMSDETGAASITSENPGQNTASEQAPAATTGLQVVLASASPRRKELLEKAGVSFQIRSLDVDESLEEDLLAQPFEAAKKLAERKACAVVEKLLNEGFTGFGCVIGADTMVVLDNEIFGKPESAQHARDMLDRLSGRTHQVMTGVSLWMIAAAPEDPDSVSIGFRSFTDVADVTFRPLSNEEISAYLQTDEPYDKAGAYAVQGLARAFVERIEGSEDTVIGLPAQRLLQEYPELLQTH